MEADQAADQYHGFGIDMFKSQYQTIHMLFGVLINFIVHSKTTDSDVSLPELVYYGIIPIPL